MFRAPSLLPVLLEQLAWDGATIRSGRSGHRQRFAAVIITGLTADRSGPAAGTGRTVPVRGRSISVQFTGYSFGSVRVDGVTYDTT